MEKKILKHIAFAVLALGIMDTPSYAYCSCWASDHALHLDPNNKCGYSIDKGLNMNECSALCKTKAPGFETPDIGFSAFKVCRENYPNALKD